MTPGSLILLHNPYATVRAWGELPEMLRSYGLDVIAPNIPDSSGMRYVARASLIVAATAPAMPLVLVGHGAAGPLLPALASAQRAAHRPIGGYVFMDADVPVTRQPAHDHGEGINGTAVPVPADWPEAPCGYLRTSSGHVQQARQARLRGWPVAEPLPPIAVAHALKELITAL